MFFGAIFFWLLQIFSANAGTTPQEVPDNFKTSVGAKFVRIKLSAFGSIWRAPDGTLWLKDLASSDTTYFNESQNHRFCQRRGGRLPTRKDYTQLATYFEHKNGEFNQQGRQDFRTIFPDVYENSITGRWAYRGLWTADKEHEGAYYSFDSYRGIFLSQPPEMFSRIQCIIE